MQREKRSKSNSDNTSGNNQNISIDINLGKKITEKITKIKEIEKPKEIIKKDLEMEKSVNKLKELIQKFENAVDRAENKKIKVPKNLSDIPDIYSKIKTIDDVRRLNKELLRRIEEINNLKIQTVPQRPLYTSGFNQTFPTGTPQTNMAQQFINPQMPMPQPKSTINVNTPITPQAPRPNIPRQNSQLDCPGYTDTLNETRKQIERTFIGIQSDDVNSNRKMERTQNLIKELGREYSNFNISQKCEPIKILWQDLKIRLVNYLNGLLDVPKDSEEPEPGPDVPEPPSFDEAISQPDLVPGSSGYRFTPEELKRLTTAQLYIYLDEIQRNIVSDVPDETVALIKQEINNRSNQGGLVDSTPTQSQGGIPMNVVNSYEELRLRGVLSEPFYQQYNLSLDPDTQTFEGKTYNFFKLSIDDVQQPYLFNGQGRFLTQMDIDTMGTDLETQPVPNQPEAVRVNHELSPETRTESQEVEAMVQTVKSKCATSNTDAQNGFFISASSPGGGTWLQYINCTTEEAEIFNKLSKFLSDEIGPNLTFLPTRTDIMPIIP